MFVGLLSSLSILFTYLWGLPFFPAALSIQAVLTRRLPGDVSQVTILRGNAIVRKLAGIHTSNTQNTHLHTHAHNTYLLGLPFCLVAHSLSQTQARIGILARLVRLSGDKIMVSVGPSSISLCPLVDLKFWTSRRTLCDMQHRCLSVSLLCFVFLVCCAFGF